MAVLLPERSNPTEPPAAKSVRIPSVKRPEQVPHFSYSQLSMFLRCSMQYYFRYVLKLKERPNLPMTNGKAAHKALEMNARAKIASGADLSLEQILDTYSADYDKMVADLEAADLKGANPAHTKDGTVQTLTIFRAKEAPLVTPKAVELPFLIPLPATEDFQEETLPVLGFIDQIASRPRVMQPGAQPIIRTSVDNHKFRNRMPSNLQEAIDLSDQHTIYDLVLTRAGVPTDDLTLQTFVPPTKTIGARIIRAYRSPKLMTPAMRASRIERALYKLRQVARLIKLGAWLPQDNPQTCAWCGFRDRCQYSLVKSDYDAMQIRSKTGAPPQ